MKMTEKILSIILVLAVTLTTAAPLAAANEAKPVLPGITVADEHPNGCVDCHKAFGGKDFRLNRGLAAVEAHSGMDAAVRNLPQDCMKCHKVGGAAESLGEIIHKTHFGNPAKSAFIAYYQGSCLHCHHIDPKSGEMTLKSGPRNW